jgi:hypothetical protein
MTLYTPTPTQPVHDLDEDDVPRKRAIERINRRRRFHLEAAGAAVAIFVLVLIWAISEYHNAGGWPTQGFSQSSGIHDVWNYWIVYPVGAILLVLGFRTWSVYGRKPVSEEEIEREIRRVGDDRRDGSHR